MGDLVASRRNVNARVVDSFGHEWSRFDNRRLARGELLEMFESYTSIFPFGDLPQDAVGSTRDADQDGGHASSRNVWGPFIAWTPVKKPSKLLEGRLQIVRTFASTTRTSPR